MRRLAIVVALVLTVAIAWQQRHRVELKLRAADGGHVSDFDRFMIMVPHFLDDHADYVDDQFPTPPLTLAVFAPLARLSRPNAIFVWVLLKLPLALLSWALALSIARRSGAVLTPAAEAAVLALWWLPLVVDAQEGQTNFLALVPLLAALRLAQGQRGLSDMAAGLAVALATSMKVTPIIFLAYFALKRRWWVVTAGLLGLVLWLVVVPAMFFGWDQNLRWLDAWSRIMILPYAHRGDIVYATSQSIPSFLVRTLTATPAFVSHEGGAVIPHFMNLLELPGDAVRLLVRVVLGALGLYGLMWAGRPLASLRSRRYLVELGVVAAFMLWASERTWVHHYVSAILTWVAASALVGDATLPPRWRSGLRAALAVSAVCALGASEAGRLFGPHGVDWAKALGVFLLPSLVVAGFLVQAEAREPDVSSGQALVD